MKRFPPGAKYHVRLFCARRCIVPVRKVADEQGLISFSREELTECSQCRSSITGYETWTRDGETCLGKAEVTRG